MDRFVFLIFSFFAVISIVSLAVFIGPESSGLGTYGSGEKPGYAADVLTNRIVKPAGGDGVPRETALRKGALESFGDTPCPEGYRLASLQECRFVPCISLAAEYMDVNPGKLCKPIIVVPPVYPEEGILK